MTWDQSQAYFQPNVLPQQLGLPLVTPQYLSQPQVVQPQFAQMNLGPNLSHGTFPLPSPTLNQVQGIPQMARKPSMVSHSQPVPLVGVPSQAVYPNQLTYGSGGKQVPVYGIPQQQSTRVPPPVYGISVLPQHFVPTQSGYQPQHGYPRQVMGSQPYYGGGAP